MNRCGICGEPFRAEDDPLAGEGSDARAEMFDPNLAAIGVEVSGLVHAECGLASGFEVA